MRRFLLAASILCLAAFPAAAQLAYEATVIQPAPVTKIKTRLDHLIGTPYVLVVSHLPAEITSITCDSWTMLGLASWHGQNNFTIPGTGTDSVASISIINAKGFDGYCKGQDSVVAHTDDGDQPCHLDRGAGNWSSSTKLTCDLKK